MFDNTVLVTLKYYYPFGNTPAVCLTQDLPPEQDADILCLGCGDARNILFTCFADAGRKLDVTCCDFEPGIHARNVLLYSMLIDDKENANIELIWNVYYHWKLDEESVELLESQTQKLLQLSESMDTWHRSVYGSCIRFCDLRSLTEVRSYWVGFRSRGLSPVDKEERLSQLEGAMERAKADREKRLHNLFNFTGYRSAAPVGIQAVGDLSKVSEKWWKHGTTGSTKKATYLNAAFLYTSSQATTLHYGLSPLLGFPLSTAYVQIAKGSTLHFERHSSTSSVKRLVHSAKSHFIQWAAAFRKAVGNKTVIRIFCGDALNFGCTLRHCQLTGATSMNLFCDNWSNSPLNLGSDYGGHENAAPVSFDVVDTSNLADHSGPLNLIGIASTLLKYDPSSSLYTEMLVQHDTTLSDRFSGFFGVDVLTMSLLFGLVLPELFTNAMDSVEDDSVVVRDLVKMMGRIPQRTTQVRSRLRWKRLHDCGESRHAPGLHIEAKALANLLIQLYDSMFKYEDRMSTLLSVELNASSMYTKAHNFYNRSSFALCLNVLRGTVVSDWDQCVEYIYKSCIFFHFPGSISSYCVQDLLLNMHLFGVDNGTFHKPSRAEMHGAILAPILPIDAKEDIPEQLCVTVRVAREKLKVFTSKKVEKIGVPAIVCRLEGGEPDERHWLNIFSAVQIAFGTWHAQRNEDLYPYIVEDSSQLQGRSDMFVSVIVPTWMLLQSKCFVPIAKVGIMSTALNTSNFFEELGLDLCFACEKMTSGNVFVTRFMPGMPALPTFVRLDKLEPVSATTTTLQFTPDGSRVNTLKQRVVVECPATRAKLADKSSTVNVEFRSPLTAVINIAQSEKIKLKLPLPLSSSKPVIRIARKSSYIEVESPLFDPLSEDASMFVFPVFFSDNSNVPTLWTSTRVDLDLMPRIDLSDTEAVSWLNIHASLMFSDRELRIRESNVKDPMFSGAYGDTRVDLKDGLLSLFMRYTGLQGVQKDIFGLSKTEDDIIQTLIFPSCLRLDLVNHTVILDSAIIPLTDAMLSDKRVSRFLEQLTSDENICRIMVSEAENLAWKATMPALVERCRTWKHNHGCEYVQADEVPVPQKLGENDVWPICRCGIGQFPAENYLKSQLEKLPELSYMAGHYATRAAIALVFPVPYVENCYREEIARSERQGRSVAPECTKCGKGKQKLLLCSRCRAVKYCSKECQKLDYKKHKLVCSAA